MPEHSDYEPAPWSAGDTFASARATYDSHVGRSYDDAVDRGVRATDLVPAKLTTSAQAPLVIITDETGSMGAWPATIFSKLGFFVHEAKFYLGDDHAIAFGAFGDARNRETYPVQMRPFGKDEILKNALTDLVIEGKGGGNIIESAELAALYVDRNVEAPNAIRPILILITDEKCYDSISPDQARQWCKVDLNETLSTKALFESLKSKWSVYLIRKPYGTTNVDTEDDTNRQIRTFWEDLIGVDHIAFLPDADRAVDVIFGILAKETGKIDDFRAEIKDRQLKDDGGEKKVATAFKALETIHRDSEPKRIAGPPSLKKLPAAGTPSVTRRPDSNTKRSKSLLDDDGN